MCFRWALYHCSLEKNSCAMEAFFIKLHTFSPIKSQYALVLILISQLHYFVGNPTSQVFFLI